jgi:hypothetical protein
LDHADIGTLHYKLCDLGAVSTVAGNGEEAGNVHIIIQFLNPKPQPPARPPPVVQHPGTVGAHVSQDVTHPDGRDMQGVQGKALAGAEDGKATTALQDAGKGGDKSDTVAVPARHDWEQWAPLGLIWESAGFDRPVFGIEIKNTELAAVLQRKLTSSEDLTFSEDELQELEVAAKYAAQTPKKPLLLSWDSFIQVRAVARSLQGGGGSGERERACVCVC